MTKSGVALCCLVSCVVGVGLAPLFPKGPGGAANRDMFKPFGGASSVAKEPIQDWRRILPLVKSLTANDLIRICGIGDADEAEAMRFAEWGARDPAAAIAVAGGNFLLIEQAAWAAAETQPEVAVELLKPFTTPPFRVFDGDVDRLISEFFELWANNDHDAAKRALQDDHWKSLADGKDFELLDDLTRGVGKYWPEDNPAGWVRWMAEFAVDGRDDFSYFTRAVSWGRPQSQVLCQPREILKHYETLLCPPEASRANIETPQSKWAALFPPNAE